jgi:hypothetical protein
MDPKPVHVTYPDGAEEMGLLVADDRIELGARAHLLALGEALVVDGLRREVLSIRMRGRLTQDVAGPQRMDHVAIVHLGPPPP